MIGKRVPRKYLLDFQEAACSAHVGPVRWFYFLLILLRIRACEAEKFSLLIRMIFFAVYKGQTPGSEETWHYLLTMTLVDNARLSLLFLNIPRLFLCLPLLFLYLPLHYICCECLPIAVLRGYLKLFSLDVGLKRSSLTCKGFIVQASRRLGRGPDIKAVSLPGYLPERRL